MDCIVALEMSVSDEADMKSEQQAEQAAPMAQDEEPSTSGQQVRSLLFLLDFRNKILMYTVLLSTTLWCNATRPNMPHGAILGQENQIYPGPLNRRTQVATLYSTVYQDFVPKVY